MEEKQIKKRTNWKKKYNDLVKIYQELYLPLCRYLTNDILPILNTQQFNVMCDVYSLKPKNVLALASLLRRDLNSKRLRGQQKKRPFPDALCVCIIFVKMNLEKIRLPSPTEKPRRPEG